MQYNMQKKSQKNPPKKTPTLNHYAVHLNLSKINSLCAVLSCV